jgi:hypothetical protein
VESTYPSLGTATGGLWGGSGSILLPAPNPFFSADINNDLDEDKKLSGRSLYASLPREDRDSLRMDGPSGDSFSSYHRSSWLWSRLASLAVLG